MVKTIKLLLLVSLLCTGCGLRAREEALQKRDAALSEKEQQLLLREKELNLKEEQLTQLEKKIDSARVDTAIQYNEQLIGLWNVKMTCTEASCPGSAIGDTRNETWEFSYQNNHLFAKATNGSELVRTYTGSMQNNQILLRDVIADSSAANVAVTRMQVRLTWNDGNPMEGQREILRENDCRIIFRLQVGRQQ